MKNTDLEAAISVQRSSLKTAVYETGMEIYDLGSERLLTWADETKQIRQNFTLIMTRPLTKNQAYDIVNSVKAQPLKFTP